MKFTAMANDEVGREIDTLESLVLGLHFSIPHLIIQRDSNLAFIANDYLNSALTSLSDCYVLKGIFSKMLGKNVYDECIYRSIILNPAVIIKDNYPTIVPGLGTSFSLGPDGFFRAEQFIAMINISDTTEDSAFLNNAKRVSVESPEKALELCKYN